MAIEDLMQYINLLEDLKSLLPTLRERAALQAMEAMISYYGFYEDPAPLAREAVKHADAVIAELEKDKTNYY